MVSSKHIGICLLLVLTLALIFAVVVYAPSSDCLSKLPYPGNCNAPNLDAFGGLFWKNTMFMNG